MNSDIIFSIVVVCGIAALVALYYKTFVLDRTTLAQKIDSHETGTNLVERLNRSDASSEKGILP